MQRHSVVVRLRCRGATVVSPADMSCSWTANASVRWVAVSSRRHFLAPSSLPSSPGAMCHVNLKGFGGLRCFSGGVEGLILFWSDWI